MSDRVPPAAAADDPALWEEVFRRAEVPLFLEDISAARGLLDRARAEAGPGGLRPWLDARPDFIGKIIGAVRVLDVNDAAVRLNAAASREELLTALDQLVVPETLPAFKDLICLLAEGAPRYAGECRYRALDGREYDTLNRARLPGRHDRRQLMVIATVEITDLKLAQRALTESEGRYRQLIETARDAIIRHDLTGRLTFVNRAAVEILGRPREELVGLPSEELLTEGALAEAEQRSVARKGGDAGVFLYETEYRHRDGHAIPFEVSSTLLPGRPDGSEEPQVLLVARDISERRRLAAEQRRLDARLRDSHKLESLGVLAGGIAHDFNNLLVTILGNAEILRADLGEGDWAPQIRAIVGAGRQAAGLCREMLAYTGAEPAASVPADLSAMVREMQGLLAATASGGAHVGLELADGLPAVRVDPVQIRQVVINLVTNASQAVAEEGGEVLVRTGVRHTTADDPPGWRAGAEHSDGLHVFCEVRDSGLGMAPEVVRRVCDPFFSTRSEGRGLGLSAALGIVRSHGGQLVIDSHPGHGTSASFWLPAVAAAAGRVRRPRTEPAEVDLTGRTVLFVEDEAEVRRVGESFLRRLGCRVLTAADGYDAVRLFGQRHGEIDVVLLDYSMPGLDGIATCRRLRVIRPDVPVVYTSGRNETEVRSRAADLDVGGFLAKPYSLRDVRSVLGGVFAP